MFRLLLLALATVKLVGALELTSIDHDEEIGATFVLVKFALEFQKNWRGVISYYPVMIFPTFMFSVDLNKNTVSTYSTNPKKVNFKNTGDLNRFYESHNWAKVTLTDKKLQSFEILMPGGIYAQLMKLGQTIAFSGSPEYLPHSLSLTPFLLKYMKLAVNQLDLPGKFPMYVGTLRVDGNIDKTTTDTNGLKVEVAPIPMIRNLIFESLEGQSVLDSESLHSTQVEAVKSKNWFQWIKSWFFPT